MLSISVPSGAGSRAAITFFAERAAASGISRDKILVSTREAGNTDPGVDVSYITYTAKTEICGVGRRTWLSQATIITPKNFGCSVQHNIAAMVANPATCWAPAPWDRVHHRPRHRDRPLREGRSHPGHQEDSCMHRRTVGGRLQCWPVTRETGQT
jgi:hypothetical protein